MRKISFIIYCVLFIIPHKMNSQTIESKINSLEQLWATDTLFRTPESVIYDKTANVFYVSNVNMNPWEKDENGFISILGLDGKIKNLKWIEGLSAPKGMGIIKRSLFVADLNQVVEIDIKSGKIVNRFQFEEKAALNDITVKDDGTIFISDSNNGRVFSLKNSVISTFIQSDFNRPNGIIAEKKRLLLLTSGGQQLLAIDYKTKSISTLVDSIGRGDGLKAFGDGGYLASNWTGELYYISSNMKKNKLIDTKEQNINCADFEYIAKDNLILVPTFFNNRVVAYKFKK